MKAMADSVRVRLTRLDQCLALEVLFACCVLSGCGLCVNELLQEARSPDGKYKAVAFNRNCGATVGNNVQVSIIPSNASMPDGTGNVFIEDHNQPVDEKSPIGLLWKDSKSSTNHALW